MKTRSQFIGITLTGLFVLTSVGSAQVPERKGIQTAAEKISAARVFSQPITYTSEQPPNESQSLRLAQAIESFKLTGPRGGVGSLEAFIASNPQSPWTPSLRAQLGKYYLDKGRFTLALEHWEKAWNGAKDSQTKGGRMAADFALAHWTRLLGSLGRREALTALMAETKNRVLSDPSLQMRLNATREGFGRMMAEPGGAYRCGTFALDNVGRTLKGTNYNFNFAAEKSPASGFSLDSLFKKANEARLDLIAVQRENNAELVVPSIVHWKQDHYAAIVGQNGDHYKVIDPTFGTPHWFSKEAIDAESSGFFMIPRSQYSAKNWRLISVPESRSVFGKGYYTVFTYEFDCSGGINLVGTAQGEGQAPTGGNGPGPSGPPIGFKVPPGLPPSGCSSCSGGSGGSGGSGATCPGPTGQCLFPSATLMSGIRFDVTIYHEGGAYAPVSPLGMADWSVSQPYNAVWLTDIPMAYNSPINGSVSFRLQYKQNQTRPANTNIFGFGPLWHGNVTTYMKVIDTQEDPDYQYYQATLYGTDGTERQYLWDDSGYEFYSRTKMERLTDGGGALTGFKVLYSSGAEARFTYLRTNLVGELEAFLTTDMDVTGKGGITLNYETTNDVVRLTTLVDSSGLTNTFHYHTNQMSVHSSVCNLSFFPPSSPLRGEAERRRA